MKQLRKIQIINSRIEFHIGGLCLDVHFIPGKAFRHYLTKQWVFARKIERFR
jgi:hypothetical protein